MWYKNLVQSNRSQGLFDEYGLIELVTVILDFTTWTV